MSSRYWCKCGTDLTYYSHQIKSCGFCAADRQVTFSFTQTDNVEEFSLARFFKAEDLADVEIVVKNDRFPEAGTSFKAHRMILALQNDVFRAMFYGDFAKEERVLITDLHPEGVLGLLRFFYSGKLDVDTVHQAVCTRSAAEKYLVPQLAEKCIAYVKFNMTVADVCSVLDYAFTMGESHNDFPAKDLLLKDGLAVLNSQAFLCCSEYTTNYVIDHVVDVPEISLFRAVHKRAEEQCIRGGAVRGEGRELRTFMQPFFPKLRFLALKAEEFASGPNLWGILNDCEARAVMSNFLKRGSVALPDGFSNIDYPRAKERKLSS